MKLKILQVGEQILRRRARPLSRREILSGPIQELIECMHETMHDAPGVGLAAPQIGRPLQLAVIEDRLESMKDVSPEHLAERDRKPVPFHVVINPKLSVEGPPIEFFEGCLSLAGFSALVPRATRVRVDCFNERGKKVSIHAAGWYARILQHEIDHLNGIVYIDRMWTRSLTTHENLLRYWKDRPITQVRAELGLDGSAGSAST